MKPITLTDDQLRQLAQNPQHSHLIAWARGAEIVHENGWTMLRQGAAILATFSHTPEEVAEELNSKIAHVLQPQVPCASGVGSLSELEQDMLT